ncbi:hypothetical protein DFO66_103393 [Brevibacterium sanguinis]|uniref:Tail protein n=2 Tax=Brevibacterium TaxID=1696 RepID=A0A366IND3_9MICO|nr:MULTISPECIES: hypothetical protein [Brevibacterium]RBP66443.1 hypothetical protein DFO66_103393 [Brevibacterium sanguinis]RBP73095.1 hypothetical protein DFO65_103393 [Brevibacterium celere]
MAGEVFWAEMNGYRFSVNDDFFARKLDLGTLDWRTQDVDRPGGDGRIFGRDYANPGTVIITAHSTAGTAAEARENLRGLAAAWRWSEHRDDPGAYTYLKLVLEGVEGVIYGRPRKFTPELGTAGYRAGGQGATLEFVPLTDLIFDLNGFSNNIHISILPNQSLGLEFPAIAPFFFEGEQTQRQGQIVNDSLVPVPFRVAFHGPVIDPAVTSTVGGWEIGLETTIPYDQTIIVDTLANTVTRESDGASFADTLTYQSDLSARLAPGAQEVVFSGRDSTNTASVDVSWSDAVNGF